MSAASRRQCAPVGCNGISRRGKQQRGCAQNEWYATDVSQGGRRRGVADGVLSELQKSDFFGHSQRPSHVFTIVAACFGRTAESFFYGGNFVTQSRRNFTIFRDNVYGMSTDC